MSTDVAALAASLEAGLATRAGLHGRVEHLARLTGGATKQTWSFDLVSDSSGAAGRVPLILQQTPETNGPIARSKPSAPKLTAAEDAALMTVARAHGVPAPEVHAVFDASDPLGASYVTGRVDGETLGRKVATDPALALARAPMAAQAGTILATIARLPTDRLPFLQRLSPADELRVYGDLLARTGVRHPALEFAIQWIRQHLPDDDPSGDGVVHGDFRTGNLIVGPQGIACVLDWEIARIGDPMQDLGVLCMKTWRFGGIGEAGGFGSRDDLHAAYERVSGVRVDPARVRFWEAFSNLKWAIGCVRRGLQPSAGIELRAVGRRLEEPLMDFFDLVGVR